MRQRLHRMLFYSANNEILLGKKFLLVKARWLNGGASDSRSEGCVLKSRPSQDFSVSFYNYLILLTHTKKNIEKDTYVYMHVTQIKNLHFCKKNES